MKERKKILFVTYGGSHADLVASLIPAVRNHTGLDYQILALTIAGQKLEPLKCQFKRCKDYLPMAGYEKALQIGKILSKKIWDETSGIPFEDSCAYLGISMMDLIYVRGEKAAWDEYHEVGRKAFLSTNFLQRVLDLENPDIVITTCNVRMERAAHLSALKAGILSVRIEDLLGYSVMGENPITSTEPELPKAEWPDRIIVPNEFTRKRMLSAGFEEWRVVALGQPFLSQWLEDSQSKENKACRQRLFDSKKPKITYIMPGRKDVLFDQASALIQLAKRRSDWEFLFKLHPGVPKKVFYSHAPDLPNNISLIYGGNLREIVNQTRLMITFKSTVGYLGLLSGVPLIILNCTGEPNILPYVSEGMATGVYSYEEMEYAIEQNLANDHPVDMKSNILEIQTGAAQRIADFLANLPTKKNVKT